MGPLGFPEILSRKNLSFYELIWSPVLDDTRTFNVLKRVLVTNVLTFYDSHKTF